MSNHRRREWLLPQRRAWKKEEELNDDRNRFKLRTPLALRASK
jgi:hypothetical protein